MLHFGKSHFEKHLKGRSMQKLLIICGPTATGKTALAIKLAKKFDGEIVNADSRQVYRGMDIGTGKDIDKNSEFRIYNSELKIRNPKLQIGYREKDGIPIWLVDICDPDYWFNVGDYEKLAKLVIFNIQKRGKLPIIVGGTGLFIRSIIDPLDKIAIPPNIQLRQQLNDYTIQQLKQELIQLDKTKFLNMNNSDQNNPRRLIRAIEIINYAKCHSRPDRESSPKDFRFRGNDINKNSQLYPSNKLLWLGLTISFEKLSKKIENRVDDRIKQGIISEIKLLLDKGYSWNLPSMSALGYREWKNYITDLRLKINDLRDEQTKTLFKQLQKQVIEKWKLHEKQYAKRQMTYFKKFKQIKWYDISDANYTSIIETKVGEWYNQ